MDLRKLRNHPQLEVAQVKKDMKTVRPYLYILALLIFIVSMIFGLQKLYVLNQRQKAPIKVYKAVPAPSQEERTRVNTSASPRVVTTETDSSSETRLHSTPPADTAVEENSKLRLENETPAPATQSASAAAEPDSERQKSAADEEARKIDEMLKAKKAEVDQALADGDAILSQARKTMNQAAPLLANHLNTLSTEGQRAFLNQIRTQMYSQSPPVVQELMDADPEVGEKAWQTFLDLLSENGYQPK